MVSNGDNVAHHQCSDDVLRRINVFHTRVERCDDN